MELRCECRDPVVRASLANDDRPEESGTGGASLLPLFLLRPNNDRPPLDVRPDLSPEENMFATLRCGGEVVDVLTCLCGGYHAASCGQERRPVFLLLLLSIHRCCPHHISRAPSVQQRCRARSLPSGSGNTRRPLRETPSPALPSPLPRVLEPRLSLSLSAR